MQPKTIAGKAKLTIRRARYRLSAMYRRRGQSIPQQFSSFELLGMVRTICNKKHERPEVLSAAIYMVADAY